jgi:hypothetical protein
MTNSHMNRNAWWCILLLTVAVFFPLTLSAREQTQAAPNEAGFYYTVQEGDTLWDISRKLFKDPELWPDLWGQNQELSNPHWIYPGNVLHIYMRGGKIYVEKVDKQPAPAAPTPEIQAKSPYYLYASIDKVGFIRKPAVVASGLGFKIQGGKVMAGTGDILYIRQNNGTLPVGSRFTLYRTYGPVENPADEKATMGTQHYFTGVAEVTRQEEGYVLAEVVESYRTIQVDDRAMPYEKRQIKIHLPENQPQISGTILRSEERGELMGEFSIAFIDKGRRDGVADGQQFRVYNQQRQKLTPKDREATLLPPEEVATLLVLHTEENTATVVVLASDKEFTPGTKFTTTLN